MRSKNIPETTNKIRKANDFGSKEKRITLWNFFERKIIRNIKEIERDWNFIKNE